jgi:chromosome segregation ATPase
MEQQSGNGQGDVDVTALAFAQYVSELKQRAASAHHQLHAEMGVIRNAISANSQDLGDFKRNTASVQQQMQTEISQLREALSSVFIEITNAVRSGSESDHDLKLNFQSLDEQIMQNDTLITQLSESAELSQVQMQEFVAELQTQAERVRDELAGLKQYVTDLETKSSERAAALSVAVSDLAKKRANLQDQRKEQVAKMRVEAQKLLEPLNTLVLDMQEHRKEQTAAQNRVQQAVFGLDEARRQEENQEQEIRTKLRGISGSITQSADQLRLVGSVGNTVRMSASQAQAARRPSQEASSPSRSVTAYPPGNSLSPTVTAAHPGYSARR